MFQTVKIGPTVLEPEGERQEGRQGVSMKRERDIIYQLENAYPMLDWAHESTTNHKQTTLLTTTPYYSSFH